MQNSTKEIPALSNYEEDKEPNSQEAPRQKPSSLKRQTSPRQKKIYNQTPSSPVQEFTSVQNPPIKLITPVQAQPTDPVQPVSPVIEFAQPLPNIKFNAPPPPLYKPKLIIKHRHTDTVNKAVATFKNNVDLHGWKFYMENKGVKIYMKDVEGRSNPVIRGDYTINGNFMASDFVAAAKNSNMRKLCK
jgi:hypothetical protein